jgi:hypothetical protein
MGLLETGLSSQREHVLKGILTSGRLSDWNTEFNSPERAATDVCKNTRVFFSANADTNWCYVIKASFKRT